MHATYTRIFAFSLEKEYVYMRVDLPSVWAFVCALGQQPKRDVD